MKHFISLADLTPVEFNNLLDLAGQLKQEFKSGQQKKPLAGKTLAMIFSKSSTRTRVSFETGMYQLGGHALFLSHHDIQLGRGESIHDTAKVLSRFVDGIMIRTFSHQDVIDLAEHGTIPVINGLTDLMHPCQALADLQTVREHRGELKGRKLAYLGDGNNVAHSLLHACALAGMNIAVASPAGYSCDPVCVAEAQAIAAQTGAEIIMTTDAAAAAKDADAIYTDTWVSMGQEGDKQQRLVDFDGYQVNDAIMALAAPGAVFLHCLPAYRGYEVTESVIDGPQSAVFDEAENRLHAQKAILVTLLAEQA
ncbi:MAG: ornithine carbamoyltransferase [Ruminococcaceae bacterium]|nr:ornithine carbamoyltransferase [Oscillospiraceae bacterium]